MKTNIAHSEVDLRIIRNPIARFRLWLAATVQRNPVWLALNWISRPIAAPFKGFARYVLVKVPAFERLDWLLEIRSLANRAPFLISISLILCVRRGFSVTQFGHIGTDRAIYPLIALIGSFNPFFAICCAALFGVSDMIQKLFFVNDIYGAPDRFSLQFVGALTGYTIAYSALVVMGLAPGVVSRLARRGLVRALSRVGTADGASEIAHVPSFAEDAFAIASSTAAAVLTMRDVVPNIEMPAFYLRPSADSSCFQLELGELQATAPYVGLSAAIGTALLDHSIPGDGSLINQDLTDRGQYIGFPTPPVQSPSDDLMLGSTASQHIISVNSDSDISKNLGPRGDSSTATDSILDSDARTSSSTPSEQDARAQQDSSVASAAQAILLDSANESENVLLDGTKLVTDIASEAKTGFDTTREVSDAANGGNSILNAAGDVAKDAYSSLVKSDVSDALERNGSTFDLVGTGVSAWDQYTGSNAQTTMGKILDATGAAEVSIMVGANPITAIPDTALNYLSDAGILPGADKYSISGTLNTSFDVISTEGEALLSGDTEGLLQLEEHLLNGDRGKVFQLAAEAGQYWQEKGLVDGLAEGDQGAEIAVRDLGNKAIESSKKEIAQIAPAK
jgi:hypothetical protein